MLAWFQLKNSEQVTLAFFSKTVDFVSKEKLVCQSKQKPTKNILTGGQNYDLLTITIYCFQLNWNTYCIYTVIYNMN